jgi:hypothetical protein
MLPLAQWVNSLALVESLREIAWYGAIINVMHLLALVVFFGALMVVDLRLMGSALTSQPAEQVANDARPWLRAGFAGLVFTGLLQLMLQPVKEYYSDLFWLKMEILLVAILFTTLVRPRIVRLDDARRGPILGKIVGLVSIALWSCVAIPARLIGLVS